MQKIEKLRGFTLVELIVVITIVGILSTVGFVSYSGYLTGAIDSNRISQITKLSDSLQVYAANKTLPLPDNYVEITESGSILAYQGEVGVDVLETIDYTNGGKDPRDDSYYTYYLSRDRNNLQLMAFMEEQESVLSFNGNQALAIDYTDSFPKTYGKDLGILTEPVTNTPIQDSSLVVDELDILNTTDDYMMHVNGRSYTGVGSKLINLYYYYNLNRNNPVTEEDVVGNWGTAVEFLNQACGFYPGEYIVVDAKNQLETDPSLLFGNGEDKNDYLYNGQYSGRLILKCISGNPAVGISDDGDEFSISGAS